MNEGDRAAKLGGGVEGKGSLSCPCHPGEVDCVSHLEIGKGAIGNSLDIRGADKLLAGFGQNVITFIFDPCGGRRN